MRKKTLIRCSVACALAAAPVAGGFFAIGCSGDDNNGGTPMNQDGGPDATQMMNTNDSGGSGNDSGSQSNPDASDAAAPVRGKVILVNAASYSPTAPALRFCYGFPTGGSVTVSTQPPIPSSLMGVPAGTGGVSPKSGVDLSNQAVVVFGIEASKLATAPDAGTTLNCKQLVGDLALGTDAGGLGLTEGTDYWNLGTLPAGTLADGTTTLVVVTGCAPGAANAVANCPANYNSSTGDLGLWIQRVDNATALDAGTIGAQFANVSQQAVNVLSANAGVTFLGAFYQTTLTPSDAGTDAGDGGPVFDVKQTLFPVGTSALTQIAPAALAPISGLGFNSGTGFIASGLLADGGETPVNIPYPLSAISQLSGPALAAQPLANGSGFVFVLVGDPLAPQYLDDAGTQFNFATAHILAFPVNPAFPAP